MNKKHFKLNVLAVALVAALSVVFVGSQQVIAQETSTANTLKVSPVRTDIEIKPGQSGKVPATVSNLTKSPIVVRPIANDFVASDEDGTPALILDADQYAPSHSLKRFMAPMPDFTIPAESSVTVNVSITVPKDATAGGYFGSVRFAPTSPDDGGQVNMSASVASLILLTVPGDFVETMNLTSFGIHQDGKSSKFFQSPSALRAVFRFSNEGNVQIGPVGKIFVKNGNDIVYEADFNNENPRELVLPGGARRWEVPLKDIGTFGHYTVHATFTYGQKNQTIEATESFWVVPTIIIVIAGVALLLIIAFIILIWVLVRRRRKGRLKKRR